MPVQMSVFVKDTKYLGHIISEKGISVDPNKKCEVLACANIWESSPKFCWIYELLSEIHQRFWQNCKASTSAGLRGSALSNKNGTKVKYPPFKCGPEQQHAFGVLKQKCCEVPVLGFTNYSPFIVRLMQVVMA